MGNSRLLKIRVPRIQIRDPSVSDRDPLVVRGLPIYQADFRQSSENPALLNFLLKALNLLTAAGF